MKEDWVIILATPERSRALNLQWLLRSNGIETFLMGNRKLSHRGVSVYIPKKKMLTAAQLLN